MKKIGSIIALVAGIFSVFVIGYPLLISTNIAISLSCGCLFASFMSIILGALAITTHSKVPGFLLMLNATLGMILGSSLVAMFMVLVFIGGVLIILDKNNATNKPEII